MKNISIEVPRNGLSIQLVLRPGASSGQAVIVASDDVEIRLAEPSLQNKPSSTARSGKESAPKAAHDFDAILKRLTKLKPTKRASAVNSIKAMFQFDAPIDEEEASKILEALRSRGDLTIDANDKLRLRNA